MIQYLIIFKKNLLILVILMKKLILVPITSMSFLSIVEKFHGIRKCNLERNQVMLFFDGIESYRNQRRKSNCLLRKHFKYPVIVFKDCVFIAENRYFMILSMSNSNN